MYLLSRLSGVLAVASVLLSMMVVAAASTLTSGKGKGGSGSIRGSLEDQQEQPASSSSPHTNNGQQTQTQTQHRMLTAGTVAELVMYDIEYGATTHYPNGHSSEVWELHFSEEESQRLGGIQDVELVHPEYILTSSETVSGDYIMLHEKLVVNDNKVHLPQGEANVEFFHSNPNNQLNGIGRATNNYATTQTSLIRDQVQQAILRRAGNIFSHSNPNGVQERRRQKHRNRNLASFTDGPLTTLVIRVIDAVGKTITNGKEGAEEQEITVAQLEDDVFFDVSSLKTQYEACSYQKLQIVPYAGTTSTGRTITNGVTDLVLPDYTAAGGDRKQIQQAALQVVKKDISTNMYTEFDLIMFCMVRTVSICRTVLLLYCYCYLCITIVVVVVGCCSSTHIITDAMCLSPQLSLSFSFSLMSL